MSFIEFFVRNAEYKGLSTIYGIYRLLLWLLAKLISTICNSVEQIYKHIFSLFGIIYSAPIVKFLKGWISYLWIPIAISVLILAYNLILGDSAEGNTKAKTFVRNLALLFIVLFGLPYLFIGHANSNNAGVFVDSNATAYTEANSTYGKTPSEIDGLYLDADSGLIDLFVNDSGQGLIKGVSSLSGTEDKSYAYSIVANNVYDMEKIFLYCAEHQNKEDFTKTWSRDSLESGKVPKNDYLIQQSDGIFSGTSNNEIMSINVMESEVYDDWNDDYDNKNMKNKLVKDFMVSDYDVDESAVQAAIVKMQFRNKMKYFTNDDSINAGNTEEELKKEYTSVLERNIEELLFTHIMMNGKSQYTSDGHIEKFAFRSGGETEADLPFGWELEILNTELFRYHIEWGVMYVQLIALIIVLFLTSYKIAKIIYEIIFDHFLAIFYGAADLSNGQRIKEVLQSIVNLIISLLFAVVSVELYLIITESINTITFIPDDPHMNKWMIALVDFFMAMAVVKGPSVLEKIMGIEGGLSGAWRDMGAATRPMKRAALAGGFLAAKGASKLAHGAAGAAKSAAKRGYYKYEKHKGKKAARKENENGNQYKIGSEWGDKSRKEVAGNESQFSAISNRRNEKKKVDDPLNTARKGKDGTTGKAANAEMARQSRDIGNDINKRITEANSGLLNGKTDEVKASEAQTIKNETANRYRGNIQNAALAEQAKARSEGQSLSDRDALQRAYENSGFSTEHASSLAARDVAGGSYQDKKDKFENSISVKAQQNLSDSPLSYKNQMEAYKDAAVDHYRALGFDDASANDMATATAERVMAEDKQSEIRSRASELQRNTANSGGSSLSDVDALEQATKEVLGNSSVGYTGDYASTANHIYEQGTLKEGIVSGRIANNAVRERAEVNTRAGSLMASSSPNLIERETLRHGGFQKERDLQSLRQTAYNYGHDAADRKAARKTESGYRRLRKERNKDSE